MKQNLQKRTKKQHIIGSLSNNSKTSWLGYTLDEPRTHDTNKDGYDQD